MHFPPALVAPPELPLRLFLLHRLPSHPGSPFYAIENFLPHFKGSPLLVSARDVLPTLRSIEINQNFEVEKVKSSMIVVILAFAMAAWLPVGGQSAPQDSSKNAAESTLVAALRSSTAQTAPVLQITLCAAKDGKPCCDAKAGKSCCAKDATAGNSKVEKDCCTGKGEACCKQAAA
jgi:hypothetical protein